MGSYYILKCPLVADKSALIEEEPDLDPPVDSWIGGYILEAPVPEPLQYEVDAEEKRLMSYYRGAIPLMSIELINALQSAGVDNLQIFNTILSDSNTGIEYDQYKAINIVGVVSATDIQKSESANLGLDNSGMIDTFFHKLVIDESKIPGEIRMFRLAERVSEIIVHQSVRDAIEKAGITDIEFK
jgi:hypothetical protein